MLGRTPIHRLGSWLSRKVPTREDTISQARLLVEQESTYQRRRHVCFLPTLSHKCVQTLPLLLHKIAQHTWNRGIGVLLLKRLDIDLLPISNPPDHLVRTPRQRAAAKTMSPEQINKTCLGQLPMDTNREPNVCNLNTYLGTNLPNRFPSS